MSTIRIAMVLGVFSVLAIGLSMGHISVLAQENMTSAENQTSVTNATGSANMTGGASISIVPNAATLGNKSYSPNPGEVKVGQSVTWTNDDTQIHTATSGMVGAEDSGQLFDTGVMTPGSTKSLTIAEAGEYDYYCTLHPQMLGKIVVS